ncbi:MAG TPA: enoyl-CoA hydratase [Usitatibacter sp.]|nr:enoyl-CoA hydratase [Usitatibacter sp.]
MTSEVLAERRGAVAAIGLHRPEKRNALTAAMYGALADAVREAEADSSVRVVLFHGEREAFTAGNDLRDFLENRPAGDDAPVFRFLRTVAGAAKPLVAAVNGVAVGIGTTLLLHCDLVYAGDDARFQLPFTRLGLVPEFASTYLLPLCAGQARAAELLLLAEPFDAARALEAGIVTRVVPAAQALDAAWEAAEKLATLPPASVLHTKALMKRAHRVAIGAQLAAEGEHFRRMLGEPAAREAFAAFLGKRAPDFRGL